MLTAHDVGAVPLDLLKLEQDRISQSLAIIQDRLESFAVDEEQVLRNVEGIFELLQNGESAYAKASSHTRRPINQAVAVRILIDDDSDRSETELVRPVALVRGVARPGLAMRSAKEPPPKLSPRQTESPAVTRLRGFLFCDYPTWAFVQVWITRFGWTLGDLNS